MPGPLTIVARIVAAEGCIEEVEASLRSLIAPTRQEPGCLNYDLHRDLERPGQYLFYENWASKPLWEDHMQSAHLKAHQQATEGKVVEFEVLQMAMVKD